MEYALVRSRPTAEGARWSFTSGNLARGTAPAKDVHLRASVMQASVLPSDTSASRIFAMGCNKRGFRPERLELSLSLPPSSRPACGVLTIDTTATPPELEAAFLGAHSASWKRRSKCPSASARRSTSNSGSFPGEGGAPAVGPYHSRAALSRFARLYLRGPTTMRCLLLRVFPGIWCVALRPKA